jgi:hypothetical protein
LEVKAYDIFDELLPELFTRRSSTGGDRAFDMGRRLNPMTAKRVKLLSLWSGRKTANSAGEVSFTANIPQFSGSARIMAVAYKGEAFGSGSKNMKITDPVNIVSSLPRFLSPGDNVIVNATLANTTSQPITVNLKATVKGAGIKISDLSNNSLVLKANSESNISYKLLAGNNIGNYTISFTAATSKETFTENVDISIRPAVPLVKSAEAGLLNAGKKELINHTTNIIEGTGSNRLLVTANPAGQFAQHLDELVNYPYGCTEQTISAAFPQLYFGDLAALLKKGQTAGQSDVARNVNEAIAKISALQQYNGGVVMWPSGGEINWWVTAYAAHFLYEAERAGYNVDKQVLANLNSYLLEKVRQKPTSEYFYKTAGSNQWSKKIQPSRETFYSLYVLALTGKHHLPTMNYYKARIDQLSSDSKYLLAGAYAIAGDKKSFSALLPRSWENKESEIMTGGSFSSPVRDIALSLYTLLTADANNPQIPVIARQLGSMSANSPYLSTQERAFTMLALGKLASNTGRGEPKATILSGGKTINFTGKDLWIDLAGAKTTVENTGKGNLYWYRESEGIPASGQVKAEDKGLKVRRQIFDRSGRQLTGSDFKLNDLLVVAVSVSTTNNSNVDNVILTDILPACFEIENTRLSADRNLDWIKNKSIPEHLDMRDDRVNIFTSANGQTKTFYYLVRVVNKGSFIHGPVGAEAMYNGQLYSYWGQGKVNVD